MKKGSNYFQVPNDFQEAISRLRIPGEARQVFDFIMRKTWGWVDKGDGDWIPLSQFVLGTGLTKSHIVRARSVLAEMKLISFTNKGNEEAKIYKINQDFSLWKPLPKKAKNIRLLPKKEIEIPKKGNNSLPNLGPSKDTESKDTVSKDNDSVENPTERLQALIKIFPETTGPLVYEYLDLLAAENKTGKISISRKIREVNRLVQVFMGHAPPDFEAGIRVACDNQAPNPNYVKAVIKGLGKKKTVAMTKEAKERKQALVDGRLESDRRVAATKALIAQMDEQVNLAWGQNAQRQTRSEQVEGTHGSGPVDQNGRGRNPDHRGAETLRSDTGNADGEAEYQAGDDGNPEDITGGEEEVSTFES